MSRPRPRRSFMSLGGLAMALATFGCPAPPQTHEPLTLRAEKKLAKLYGGAIDRYEASGVTLQDGALRMVLDNSSHVPTVGLDLSSGALGAGEVRSTNNEGITGDGASGYFIMRETKSPEDLRAVVIHVDAAGKTLEEAPTSFAFADANHGFEGVARVRVGTEELLLALCETNDCKDGGNGSGRIHVLARAAGTWTSRQVLSLPASADFEDYSDLALLDTGGGTYAVAVLSQKSSAVWIGTLGTSPLALAPGGTRYDLPRDGDRTAYCSAEGITFLDATTFAIVSDRSTDGGPCADHAEAIAIFARP